MDTYTKKADNLVAGGIIDAIPYTAAAGQEIKRGQILSYSEGKVSVTAADGTPYGIAADDVTVGGSDTDVSVPVYEEGLFDIDSIIFPEGASDEQKETMKVALRNIGIHTTKLV